MDSILQYVMVEVPLSPRASLQHQAVEVPSYELEVVQREDQLVAQADVVALDRSRGESPLAKRLRQAPQPFTLHEELMQLLALAAAIIAVIIAAFYAPLPPSFSYNSQKLVSPSTSLEVHTSSPTFWHTQ